MQAELICKEYFKIFNLQTCSIRIFSAYGNGLTKQLFWDMFNKFKNFDIVELFGNGFESRDFIHINDIVFCISLIIEKAEFNGEVLNVASGNQYFIRNVADIFSEHWGQKKKVVFSGDFKEGDPINWQANIELIKNFGFTPRVNLEDGINQYIKWAKSLD